MSLRAYSEINLHFVWRVKDNNPVLHDEVEQPAPAPRSRADVRAAVADRPAGRASPLKRAGGEEGRASVEGPPHQGQRPWPTPLAGQRPVERA